jgi:hypothetical protein
VCTCFLLPLHSTVTSSRDGCTVDTADLLPSCCASSWSFNHAPDCFQRHLHKRDMMTKLSSSVSQDYEFFTTLSHFFVSWCHYFRTCCSYPFLFTFAYPATSRTEVSTVPGHRLSWPTVCQSLQSNTIMVPHIRVVGLPSLSLPLHYSQNNLSRDTV